MRIESLGQVVFAAILIAAGLAGFVEGKFAAIWLPVSHTLPGREMLIYLCASVALLGGIGLLVRPTASIAAHIVFAYLLVWMLAFKAPFIVQAPLEEGSYQSTGENAVVVAAAWVLVTWFASAQEKERIGFLAGDLGLRLARVLYGLALVAFGCSHFVYLSLTAPIIPDWLPWHVFWAYFTGGAYLAAGVAIIAGVFARLAAVLVAVQIGLITLLVWGPHLVSGFSPTQWTEIVVSCAITAGAWVMAESYRGAPWLARRAKAG